MTHKQRALAPFLKQGTDRFPMWYGGAPETTQNIINTLGAKNGNHALFDILQLDYKTIRPKYTGPDRIKYDDGSQIGRAHV